ncbi:GDSL esterase/lipase At1g54790-like isoform X1 [Durio zibethinus]|uniref:GDSL esterase/lipase At1g54790-like isoform X1 n=1 Tax=Durio zibethinus TaxID=66656 RepID=A0A6P5WUZ6_DURZI|nr:GDSL esterase/lipase At1g54790-like isoform X1 [Durio zibethinus]
MASKTHILQIFSLVFIFLPLTNSIHFKFPAIFNFGDSNSDTGELVAAGIESLEPPHGQSYFQTPSGRYCDGRLIIDFLMDAMDLPFLNAYLDSIGTPSFRKGCNFAAAGSTIQPPTAESVSPFSFGNQVAQFVRFKARVLELLAKGAHIDHHLENAFIFICNDAFILTESINLTHGWKSNRYTSTFHLIAGKKFGKYLPTADYFQKGLYMFDIGQNDLAGAFYSKTFDQILALIPSALTEFETGIKTLYDQGARNFWIHNTGPLGCLAQNVAKFGTDPSSLDELGCVSKHNQAAKVFNLQLHALCKKLQGQYTDSNFTYVNIYTIKSNLIANYSKVGFEQPIMACCGYGGPPLNYDNRIGCGKTKVLNGTSVTAKACNDSSEYVNWDGIHYSEASNLYVSSQILTGKYSDPPFSDKMPFLLNLKF